MKQNKQAVHQSGYPPSRIESIRMKSSKFSKMVFKISHVFPHIYLAIFYSRIAFSSPSVGGQASNAAVSPATVAK